MRAMLAGPAIVVWILATSPASAAVQVVSSSGPFTSVQAAVDAASDGDTVLVRSGSYPGFVIQDKEVDVIADLGGIVSIDSPIRVQSLAAGRALFLRGLHVSTKAKEALIVVGNAGPVLVEESIANVR
jgi:pectin methylesterase-like acyl-CoA thioesterase